MPVPKEDNKTKGNRVDWVTPPTHIGVDEIKPEELVGKRIRVTDSPIEGKVKVTRTVVEDMPAPKNSEDPKK